ncbi:hypothetical protein VV01_07155 [Luteipulveratus halotolerans]|uniref:Uncharacterized protein n=1 Tax=Luteipulveratus halotolerans TaxID=1631356 RepID=A0A0L6CGZ0_9MICO|nr:hypothetical protein VV01_07155 [Luteipulveratus halotolerans]
MGGQAKIFLVVQRVCFLAKLGETGLEEPSLGYSSCFRELFEVRTVVMTGRDGCREAVGEHVG